MVSKANRNRTRILIVDDHPMVRSGLLRLIDEQKDMVCCGDAGTPKEALRLAETQNPDLAIIDLRLKNADGLDLIKDLRNQFPQIRCIVLSQYDSRLYVERALRAGASGYVVKEQGPEDVLAAIRTVSSGQVYLRRDFAVQLLQQFVGQPAAGPAGPEQLSDRELHVLQLLGVGLSTREIAEQMGISFKTVESHRENIKTKLHLRTAAELVHFATNWVAGHDSSQVTEGSSPKG
jgi:DNA-binding NarL/FixJ family response regulator